MQGRGHRSVSSDNDQGVDPQFFQDGTRIRDHFGGDDHPIARAYFRDEMAAVRCANDRAAAGHDAGDSAAIEDDVISRREQSFKAVEKSKDFPT